VQRIPVLNDNYVWLLHEPTSGATAVVDPAVEAPVVQALDAQGWKLGYILNTHHHSDHTGVGVGLAPGVGSRRWGQQRGWGRAVGTAGGARAPGSGAVCRSSGQLQARRAPWHAAGRRADGRLLPPLPPGANLALKQRYGCTVVGPRADAARIPGIDVQVGDGDTWRLGQLEMRAFDTPGHTRGHVSLWFPEARALFCGAWDVPLAAGGHGWL
jgi:glyoxylase-like metal-dependent hydrolase (beta-lactamase superfamily II)